MSADYQRAIQLLGDGEQLLAAARRELAKGEAETALLASALGEAARTAVAEAVIEMQRSLAAARKGAA